MSSSDSRTSAGAGMNRGMALDIGLPLAAYYGLDALGSGTWVSLLAATVVSGAARCGRRWRPGD